MAAQAGTKAEASAARTRPSKKNTAPYTAVIYVHGIGSQRRYEETSQLVDQIDRHLGSREAAGSALGQLREIDACVEPFGQQDTVGYIRAKLTRKGPQTDNDTIRFYEVYWAPVMAEQRSPWGVLKWIFGQPWRPFTTLNSSWRERQRLRRAVLAAMFEQEHRTASPERLADFEALLRLYGAFEGLPQQRRFPAGSFDEFLTTIGEDTPGDPVVSLRRQKLARLWRSRYQRDELRNAALLATMALAVLLLAGGLLLSVLLGLKALLGMISLAVLLQRWDISIAADWKTAAVMTVFLAGTLGVTRFLTDYMGDVEAWATYEETDAKHMARRKVLDRSLDLFTHVLSDQACTRVAVVAHSLGTSVAHDSLLALARRNRAHNPADPMTGFVDLGKIEHVVTMGSPIDKIEYFFESYVSNSHRYKRVVEDLRGDIGRAPFSRNGKPHIHWINFWDQGDPISGPLHSPAGAAGFEQRVDNVHVASYRFPAPGPSHAGYIRHRSVVDCLFQVIARRSASFRMLEQPAPDRPYDYDSLYLGPGEPTGSRLAPMLMALAAPWLALAAIVAKLAGAPALALALGLGAGSLVLLLALGLLANRMAGHTDPV